MPLTTVQQLLERKIDRRTLIKVGAAATGALALAGAGLVVPSTARAYSWPGTLKRGSSGAAVRELQIRVAGWAADGARQTFVAVDGKFGPGTEAAVRRFQRAYGLTADGVVGPQTQQVLNSLEEADGSTVHFNFAEFYSKDGSQFNGGKVGPDTVKSNVRRNMYKLEALRKKAGNAPVSITSGFRSVNHNRNVDGASNSQHMYGIASDIQVRGKTPSQAAEIARSCGYSGIIIYPSFTHVDSRAEYDYGSRGYYWPSAGSGGE